MATPPFSVMGGIAGDWNLTLSTELRFRRGGRGGARFAVAAAAELPLFDLALGTEGEAVSAATMGLVVAPRMREGSGGWLRGIKTVPAGVAEATCILDNCGGRGASSAGEALGEGLPDASAASVASLSSITYFPMVEIR